VILLSVATGEEVMETISRKLDELDILDAAIVSLIGAVEGCAISTKEMDDASSDIIIEYPQPLELSGNGEVIDGKVHLHVVCGAEGNQTVSGHLHWANVKNFSVNAYVIPLPPKA
jgi:predicted DNA-binding protein with PD1-like motif